MVSETKQRYWQIDGPAGICMVPLNDEEAVLEELYCNSCLGDTSKLSVVELTSEEFLALPDTEVPF